VDANDMMDAFDFTQAPLPPLVLQERTCPIVSTTSLFGEQTVGTVGTNKITIYNVGAQPLNFKSILLTGDPDFKVTACKATSIPPNGYCNLSVNFTPSQLGPRKATVTLQDNYPGSPQTISLTGTGSALTAQGTVLGPEYPYSSGLGTALFATQQLVGTTKQLSFTLTNVGSQNIQISSLSLVGVDFAQTNNCPPELAPSSNCRVTVTFTPSVLGPRWGQIRIEDSDPGSPHLVRLVGTAVNSAGAQIAPQEPMTYEHPTHQDFPDDDDDK
jgi:hypothetical protein